MRLELFIILLASANAGFRVKRDFGDIDQLDTEIFDNDENEMKEKQIEKDSKSFHHENHNSEPKESSRNSEKNELEDKQPKKESKPINQDNDNSKPKTAEVQSKNSEKKTSTSGKLNPDIVDSQKIKASTPERDLRNRENKVKLSKDSRAQVTATVEGKGCSGVKCWFNEKYGKVEETVRDTPKDEQNCSGVKCWFKKKFGDESKPDKSNPDKNIQQKSPQKPVQPDVETPKETTSCSGLKCWFKKTFGKESKPEDLKPDKNLQQKSPQEPAIESPKDSAGKDKDSDKITATKESQQKTLDKLDEASKNEGKATKSPKSPDQGNDEDEDDDKKKKKKSKKEKQRVKEEKRRAKQEKQRIKQEQLRLKREKKKAELAAKKASKRLEKIEARKTKIGIPNASVPKMRGPKMKSNSKMIPEIKMPKKMGFGQVFGIVSSVLFLLLGCLQLRRS